jgi:hypothetical protein
LNSNARNFIPLFGWPQVAGTFAQILSKGEHCFGARSRNGGFGFITAGACVLKASRERNYRDGADLERKLTREIGFGATVRLGFAVEQLQTTID